MNSGRADLIGGLFSNNRALGDNGGAVNVNNSISVTGTQFISNTAVQDGGGLLQWNAGSTITVTNARFERNHSGNDGGGLWVHGNATATNVVVMDNFANALAAARCSRVLFHASCKPLSRATWAAMAVGFRSSTMEQHTARWR